MNNEISKQHTPEEIEEEVKRWLESLDAEFKLDETGRGSSVSFEYAYSTFFYPELVHLKRMTGMKWLTLRGSYITDAGLVHLKGLKDLQNFRL